MRAISTVLDVSMAMMLVSAAALVLVSVPNHNRHPADPDVSARAVLVSTTTANYRTSVGQKRTVSGHVAILLGHAVVSKHRGLNPQFVTAVHTAVTDVLDDIGSNVVVSANIGDTHIIVGTRPPPSASVAAVTHRVIVGNTTAFVTVRTWSP